MCGIPGLNISFPIIEFRPANVDIDILCVNCPAGSYINKDASKAFIDCINDYLPDGEELKEESLSSRR
jgi:hypothetical protein